MLTLLDTKTSSKLVTPLGIKRDVMLVQPLKQLFPIVLSEFGREIDGNPLQPLKQLLPIDVTPFGILIWVSILHPEK